MAYKVCLVLKQSLAFKLNHHQGQGIQLKCNGRLTHTLLGYVKSVSVYLL